MSILVKGVSWTRTYFEIEYECDPGEELTLYRVAEQRFVPLRAEREPLAGGRELVRANLNVVIAGAREPLEAGDWIICTRIPDELLADEERLFEERPYLNVRAMRHVRTHMTRGEKRKMLHRDDEFVAVRAAEQRLEIIAANPYEVHGITYEDELLVSLDKYDRIFRYAKGKFVYTAALIPRTDSSSYIYVVLSMGFYERNKNPRKRKGRFDRVAVRNLSAGLEKVIAQFAPRTGKKVLFFKENGDAPNPNMAAVRDRMFERGLDEQFEIEERYRNIYDSRVQSPAALLGDLRAIARSDYIFIDDYCPVFNFVKPQKGTVLTQIWHAGVGFKSVGYARFGVKGSPNPYHSVHRNYTYALVGNEHLRSVYSEVFGIEPEALLATGMPRLDHFLDEDVVEAAREKLYARYPWMHDGRVIVFAPTFRGPGQKSASYPYDVFLDMDRIYEMCEKTNSYFVFEMHPFVPLPPEIPEEYSKRLVDLTEEDLTELYHVSDVLVTDYSSCFYDYLLLKKPVVFYVPDKVAYEVTRGVQRTVDEMAPGVICDTFDEFMEVLETSAYENVEPDPSCLDRKIEGGMLACDRVIDTILLGKDVPGVRA